MHLEFLLGNNKAFAFLAKRLKHFQVPKNLISNLLLLFDMQFLYHTFLQKLLRYIVIVGLTTRSKTNKFIRKKNTPKYLRIWYKIARFDLAICLVIKITKCGLLQFNFTHLPGGGFLGFGNVLLRIL